MNTNVDVSAGLLTKGKKQKESHLQSGLISWWRMAHRGLGVPDARLLYMVPNGTFLGSSPRRFAIFASLLKQGFVQGVPDLCLAVMRHGYGALYLEMKMPKGVISPAQRELHELLRAQGYAVAIPRTFDEAVSHITSYLSARP